MTHSLENQVAIITGGNAGIGRAIALKFAKEGAKVLIFGTNEEKGRQVTEEIARLNQQPAQFYAVDVSQTQQVEDTIKKILDQYKNVDLLVNNAGITADQLLMKMSEQDWDSVLNINLKSCYNTCHALIRSMMKAKKGKIINISSVVGLTGNAGQVNYAASKAGMIGLTKALAKEVASRGIQVNCIAPGFIKTAMTDTLTAEQKEQILRSIPMGCMGEPEDIAEMAWFLAIANYMTGQVLTVDGGMVM